MVHGVGVGELCLVCMYLCGADVSDGACRYNNFFWFRDRRLGCILGVSFPMILSFSLASMSVVCVERCGVEGDERRCTRLHMISVAQLCALSVSGKTRVWSEYCDTLLEV